MSRVVCEYCGQGGAGDRRNRYYCCIDVGRSIQWLDRILYQRSTGNLLSIEERY